MIEKFHSEPDIETSGTALEKGDKKTQDLQDSKEVEHRRF
jgi:hypothetical protein